MPSKLWERIKLSPSYSTALTQIDDRLIYWPKFLIHKCKQRLTRLTQVAIMSRRLAKEDARLGEKTVGVLANKVRRRERTRERKALAAAKVERAIERELVERLRSGAYGDRPLNVEEGIWKKVLKALEKGGEATRDEDLLEDEEEDEEENELEEEEEMENEEGMGEVEYVSGDEDLEDEAEEMADLEEWLGGSGASDFEEDSEDYDDSESDSDEEINDDEADEEDESEEERDQKKAPKNGIKKGKVDDNSKKRKRPQLDQKPRKRMVYLLQPPRLEIANTIFAGGARIEIEYENETPSAAKDLAF